MSSTTSPAPPPATDPADPVADPSSADRIGALDDRITALEQGQRDVLDASRANTEALSQVSTGLAALNERLNAAPPPTAPALQAAPPSPAPAAVQPTPAPVPGDPPPSRERRRHWA